MPKIARTLEAGYNLKSIYDFLHGVVGRNSAELRYVLGVEFGWMWHRNSYSYDTDAQRQKIVDSLNNEGEKDESRGIEVADKSDQQREETGDAENILKEPDTEHPGSEVSSAGD